MLELVNLFEMIAGRAALIKQVAANKYLSQKPIYDAVQEINVLKQVKKTATEYRLPEAPLLIFAQIQMDMAKHIEQYWMDYWTKQPHSFEQETVIPLTQIRERMQATGKLLYQAMSQALPALKSNSIEKKLMLFKQAFGDVKGIPSSPDYCQMMLHALVDVGQNAQ